VRLYLDGYNPLAHGIKGPYIDLIPTAHNVTVLFSDADGYYIIRREEISHERIIQILKELFDKEV
jgi:hypothetical protein